MASSSSFIRTFVGNRGVGNECLRIHDRIGTQRNVSDSSRMFLFSLYDICLTHLIVELLPAPSFHPQCNKICFSFICSFFKHVRDPCYKTGGTVPRQYWNLKQMKKYLLMFWGGACHRKLFPPGDGGESIPFSFSNSISSVRRSRWDWKRVRSTVWMKGH